MFGDNNQNDNAQTDDQSNDSATFDDNNQSSEESVNDGGLISPSGAEPPDDTTNTSDPVTDTSDKPSVDDDDTTAPKVNTASDFGANNDADSDDLAVIKQDALKQLSPLVKHLDQSPEEKFRTTMMMIQASDDQSLIKTAFEAAKQIKDDKARAQALLDIINEINYFTQNNNN